MKLSVHSHLEYMLQKVFKMTGVKTGKQYYKLLQISYHYQTILTFSESYWQTILHTFSELISSNTDIFRELLLKILTYSELISNSIHNFTELLPSNNKHFFESSNGHLNRQKILKHKTPK